MKIQVNTDHGIAGHAARVAGVSRVVEHALARFSDQITRIEVHLSDENGGKSGPLDQRCMLEARLQGRQPVAVTEHAASQDQALHGATDKLTHLLAHALGRAGDRRTAHVERPVAADDDPFAP
ncbi:MAG: ribosomal subunit interface protein [Rhodoferax sp.]|nr:ribosomal subunit interface protein [Rhodoferax sp.]